MENSRELGEQGNQTEAATDNTAPKITNLPDAGPDAMLESALAGQSDPATRKSILRDMNIHKIPTGTFPVLEPGEMRISEVIHKGNETRQRIGNNMLSEDDPERYS